MNQQSLAPSARSLHTLVVATDATRRVLQPLLALQEDVRIVGELANLRDARAATEMIAVDLVVIETALPDGDAFDWLRSLPPTVRIIALTRDMLHVMRALAARTLECVPLPPERSILAEALKGVRGGGSVPSFEGDRQWCTGGFLVPFDSVAACGET